MKKTEVNNGIIKYCIASTATHFQYSYSWSLGYFSLRVILDVKSAWTVSHYLSATVMAHWNLRTTPGSFLDINNQVICQQSWAFWSYFLLLYRKEGRLLCDILLTAGTEMCGWQHFSVQYFTSNGTCYLSLKINIFSKGILKCFHSYFSTHVGIRQPAMTWYCYIQTLNFIILKISMSLKK